MKNNINDITNESAWKKTSQFIEEKYGKKIEYRFIIEAAPSDVVKEQRFFIIGDDLIVPLKYKLTELGQVIISRGATLNNDQKNETADLIQFLIEPQIYNKVLKLQLSSLTQKSNKIDENVIELFSKKDKNEDRHIIDDETSSKRLISKFIHIRSKSPQTRRKVALKIHEMAGTIVMINLQDFYDGKIPMPAGEVLKMNLDATTLYIDNMLDLNPNQLAVIEQLSKLKASGNYVIIVGSSLNEDQINHLEYNREFKNDLIGLSYDADRVPTAQQASDEILDLLFFSDGDIIS
jgi:hypothetical protein